MEGNIKVQHNLKNECMACYDPVVQVHSCSLKNPREKVDRNFDDAFQLEMREYSEIHRKETPHFVKSRG